MSTRATYEFRDERSSHTVYKHHDGYPEGAYSFIRAALKNAWPIPRFEADEFGAAFIAANKESCGGIRLTKDRDAHGDTQFHYVISCDGKALIVERWEPKDFGGDDRKWAKTESGTLTELLEKHCKALA